MRSVRVPIVLSFAAFLAVVAAVPPARATVMIEIPLEDLARQADAIMHGIVTRIGTRTVARGRSLDPHTVVWIDVRDWLKGSGGSRVRLVEVGGVSGSVGLAIEGVPRYQSGEEVVVFLEVRGDRARTLALAQGRFLVRRNVGDGRPVVTRDLRGIGFATFDAKGLTIRGGARRAALPLDELVRVVTLARRYGGNPGVHVRGAAP